MLRTIARILIDSPLRYFYMQGHWRGLDEASVCASLTSYDTSFWRIHIEDCGILIDRQVHSLTVYLFTSIYFIGLATAMRQCVSLVTLCFSLAIRHLREIWRPTRAAPANASEYTISVSQEHDHIPANMPLLVDSDVEPARSVSRLDSSHSLAARKTRPLRHPE